MERKQISREEWVADKAFLPRIYGRKDTGDLDRQGRARQATYLRKTPKRRAGAAWGAFAEELCMGIEKTRFNDERDRKFTPGTFSRRCNDLLAPARQMGAVPLAASTPQAYDAPKTVPSKAI